MANCSTKMHRPASKKNKKNHTNVPIMHLCFYRSPLKNAKMSTKEWIKRARGSLAALLHFNINRSMWRSGILTVIQPGLKSFGKWPIRSPDFHLETSWRLYDLREAYVSVPRMWIISETAFIKECITCLDRITSFLV